VSLQQWQHLPQQWLLPTLIKKLPYKLWLHTVPSADAIDVSSYQGAMSVGTYSWLKSLGVKYVIVKLTQGYYIYKSICTDAD
jgi:hypothetical protein